MRDDDRSADARDLPGRGGTPEEAAEVAVAVLHYGDLALTTRCLRSTVALDPEPTHRFLIWNDPSAAPRDLSDDLGIRVETIPTERGLGYAGGANFAVRVARERSIPWLWLLTNDTEVASDALAVLLAAGRSDPRVAMVGPRIIAMDTGRIWHDGGAIAWPEGRPITVGYGEIPGEAGPPRPVEFVCGCAPLIRVEPFLAHGGFDERYFAYYEDADASLRLAREGWRLLHAPRAEVRHVGGASHGRRSPATRYYALRNRRLFRDLHAPDPDAARVASAREARTARARALRYRWFGRRADARALRAALADHAAGRYGERASR